LRKFLVSLSVIASMCLVLMVPAYAEVMTGKSPVNTSTNGTTYKGSTGITGTPYSINPGVNGTATNGVNGTYNGMNVTNGYNANNTLGNRTGTYGTYDSTRMNNYRPYNTIGNDVNSLRTNTYRTAATTTRSFNWGWLGLIGLFGLAGMRSRNRDEIR
jgi:hypothetical protein